MLFVIGESESERIEVEILGYERCPVGEYYDDNWLSITTRARTRGFQGEVAAAILAEDFVDFLAQLRLLHDTLRGEAALRTMERQLSLRLTGDSRGHVDLSGEIAEPGEGNKLHFTLQLNQSDLSSSIRQLENIVMEFPIRGISLPKMRHHGKASPSK